MGVDLKPIGSVLVLGAGGFVGQRLTKMLLARGAQVAGVDRVDVSPDIGNDVQWTTANLLECDIGALLLEVKPRVVIHLANPSYIPSSFDSPHADLEQTAGTTLRLLEAVRRLGDPPTIVYVSSAAVYGEARYSPIDEAHPLEPISPYGVSKLAAESYVRLYTRLYDLPAVIARMFSLYGPGQRKQVVYDLSRRILSGENPLLVASRPDVSRDLVYVDDAANALIHLASSPTPPGDTYNVSTGVAVTVRSLTELIGELSGQNFEVAFTQTTRLGAAHYWRGDPTRSRAIGIVCGTALESGLTATLEWVKGDLAIRSQAESPTLP
jgi:UDP-glucose 4-epimerase